MIRTKLPLNYFRDINSKSYNLKLLYRGTRDGFLSETFRQKCANQNQTFVIYKIKGKNNQIENIIGGYTDVQWQLNPDKKSYTGNKKNSFLFKFNGENTELYPNLDSNNEIAVANDLLPSFSCELNIKENCDDMNLPERCSSFMGVFYYSRDIGVIEVEIDNRINKIQERETFMAGEKEFYVLECEVF